VFELLVVVAAITFFVWVLMPEKSKVLNPEKEKAFFEKDAQRRERKEDYRREAENATDVRTLEVEIENKKREVMAFRLSGAQATKVVLAELELAEREATLALLTMGADLSSGQREELEDRLAVLQEQIEKQRKK
jgi:hypothetical protein